MNGWGGKLGGTRVVAAALFKKGVFSEDGQDLPKPGGVFSEDGQDLPKPGHLKPEIKRQGLYRLVWDDGTENLLYIHGDERRYPIQVLASRGGIKSGVSYMSLVLGDGDRLERKKLSDLVLYVGFPDKSVEFEELLKEL